MSAADAVCDANSVTAALLSHTVYHNSAAGNVTRVIIYTLNPELNMVMTVLLLLVLFYTTLYYGRQARRA